MRFISRPARDDASRHVSVGMCLCLLAIAACESEPAIPGTDYGVSDAITIIDPDAIKPGEDTIVADSKVDDACVPSPTSCQGLCGPVNDGCGTTLQCGGCDEGKACDIYQNKCITALVDCDDLQAKCGTIRNSCGVRLDCGSCGSGEECDPDTNWCVPCSQVTCQDLGYSCGKAWLGCGSPSNTTDCGSCPAGKTCSPFFNICEDSCTPEEKATLCAKAQTAKGVECGQISDGCGGTVDCGGCPEGEGCGVRGVANRCDKAEVPTECKALNKNCGTIESACGGDLHCGDCPTGEVCNANGLCGVSCTPKTCAADFAGKCGSQLDDGCNSALDCSCATGQICDTAAPGVAGGCIAPNTCAGYTATGKEGETCSNGKSTAFPKGNGEGLICPCTDGRYCVDQGAEVFGPASGTCCTNTAKCSANACTVTNSCTGAPINCCAASEYCDTSTNTCAKKKGCADYTDGLEGSECSVGHLYPNLAGGHLSCKCKVGNAICVGETPTTPGTCCVNKNSCNSGTCTAIDTCTGEVEECCTSGSYCDSGTDTCETYKDCDDYTTGLNGAPCSNSPHFSAGNNGFLKCECKDSTDTCAEIAGTPPGFCCKENAQCTGASCEAVSTCTGKPVSCCNDDEYCDSGNNVCKPKKPCSQYGANGMVSDPCSALKSSAFPAGDGSGLLCDCSSTGNNANNTCVGSSATKAGVCECTKEVCDCTNTGQSDGCGGILACACTGQQVCDTTNKVCCTPYVCTGGTGDECGIPRLSCGNTVSCKCNGQYDTCGGGGVANICGCTPGTCKGRVGVFPDGCGGTITCSG
jgi:hypothetical protein